KRARIPVKTEIVLGTVISKFSLHRLDIPGLSNAIKERVCICNKNFYRTDFVNVRNFGMPKDKDSVPAPEIMVIWRLHKKI
ncbi:MAG: hypothetical protein PVF09_16095, partial [Desulfobacterales bacterium]